MVDEAAEDVVEKPVIKIGGLYSKTEGGAYTSGIRNGQVSARNNTLEDLQEGR